MKRTCLKGVFLLFLIPFNSFAEPGPYFRFIQNKNQWPASVDYATRVPGGTMSLKAGQFTYTLLDYQKLEELHEQSHHGFQEVRTIPEPGQMIDGYTLNVDFIGANSSAKVLPFGKQDTYYNFFTGSDSSHWASDVKSFEGMIYSSLYAGIDMKIYSQGRNLKYDFIVAPGADPSQITIRYSGAEQFYLDRGDLFIKTPLGDLIEKKPVTYQMIAGERVLVPSAYTLCDNELSFSFPDGYDPCYELIIDPLLIFSTYSGSKADNWGSTATPGENGSLYSAGVTNHLNAGGTFPATAGAFQTSYGGIYDVGILKYDSTGQHLLYASYLGGSGNESAHSLVMNSNQELVVLGTTGSTNFPTSASAISKTFKGGTAAANVIEYTHGSDIYVARISKDGTQLLASTYLGGTANDGLNPTQNALSVNYGDELRGDIIADAQGNIYVSSVTASANFPVANSFSTTFKGSTDALLLKLDPSLAIIYWGAFLGGSALDASYTIKFDNEGNLFAAGGTTSADFPITTGVYQSSLAGSVDGWIATIASDGSAIIASTYTGTSSFDQIYFIDLNLQDEVYVYGQTSGSFPVTSGVYHNTGSGQFLQKFDHGLTQLKLSTVLGSGRGIPDISPTAFLVNDCNNIFMTGWGGLVNSLEKYWQSNTFNMPITSDAFQKTTSGSDFYFAVLTDGATELLYGTYMGGTDSRTHVDGGTSRFDKKGVVYHAVCSGCAAMNRLNHSTSDFPTSVGAWSRTNNSLNCNNAAFKFDLSSLRARIQTNSVKLDMPGLNKVCMPDKIVFQNRSTGGEIFQWDLGDGTKTALSDTSRIVHQYKSVGKYIVKLKAIDAGTCVGKDSTFTVVNVYTPLGVAGNGGTICFGTSFSLSASNGVSYGWTGIGNDFKSANSIVPVSPAVDSKYQVSITDFQGCVVKDTLAVKVIPGIDLQFEWSREFACESRPVTEVKNLTDENEETFWDFGDGTTSDLRTDTHTYQKDGVYAVRLVGKKDFCLYDKKVDVPVYTFFAPNVITPDQSSGKNDTFLLLYGGSSPEEKNVRISLIIYNRWGNKVYANEDYKGTWSGEGLTAGIYYYEASAEDDAACKGWVQLIR